MWCWTCWGSKRKCVWERREIVQSLSQPTSLIKCRRSQWEPKQVLPCNSWNTWQLLEMPCSACIYVTCLVTARRQPTATHNKDSNWTCSPCNFIYLFHTADINLVVHIQAFHIPSVTLHVKCEVTTQRLGGMTHHCWWKQLVRGACTSMTSIRSSTVLSSFSRMSALWHLYSCTWQRHLAWMPTIAAWQQTKAVCKR